ncbi:MAG: dihydrolipoyl dehydrogenase [Candidatus Solibacter sp.]|nr:dihydrolipoyl dehydrogenase [Candidatus Solibacter sp.]
MYDVIVIGAGPGGYEAAAHAAKLGAKVAVVERDSIGGTCLNVGCIPTKTFLRSSKLFAECRQAAAFGVELSGLRFNLAAVVERKNKIVLTLTRGVESLLKHSGVEVVRGNARLASKSTVQVGDQTLTAKNILIATGARPIVPPIPGIESSSVIDSSGVLRLTGMPMTVAIIGGGYIGLEFASFFAAAGVEVSVLEMLPQIATGSDHDISSRLQQALKKNGVVFKTSCMVKAIEGNTVHYEQSGAPGALSAECIVNATGRAPVVEGLGLAEVGVDFDRKGIKTSDRGKTNIPGIWACGDVTGRRLLAHAATREGLVAVNNMLGKPDRIRYDAIPSVIYTHPEVASAGKTENELKALGIEYKKALLPMGVAGRFLVENDGGAGMIKVLVGARYGEILGVHALGDLSSEFIVAAAAMIEMEMTVSDIEAVVFPHPTVSEALKLAILEAA